MSTKYIYLVFSRTGTWLSRSIGYVTKTEYTHVSLSLDLNLENMYSFGRLDPNNPFSGGLTIENINTGVFKKSPFSKCLIYEIEISKLQYDLLNKELNSFYNSDIVYKYNFIGLFGVLVDKPIQRQSHYFCSEFISTLLHRSGIYTPLKLPQLTSPTDLMNIPNKRVIYEGYISHLTYSNQTVATMS